MHWWVTILRMVGDHPWQLSSGVSFVRGVLNTKSVAHFLLVDFGGGCCYLLLVVTGGKLSQLLLCPTEGQLGVQVRSGI